VVQVNLHHAGPRYAAIQGICKWFGDEARRSNEWRSFVHEPKSNPIPEFSRTWHFVR
jgi:hypothetical protein